MKAPEPASPAEVTRALRDAAVLWVLDGQFQRVVDAAVACLLAGIESSAVDVLAGSDPGDPYSERMAMTAAALRDLGLEPLPDDPAAMASQGAGILTGSLATGVLSADQLGAWVTGSLACDTRARVEQALGDARPDAPGCGAGAGDHA